MLTINVFYLYVEDEKIKVINILIINELMFIFSFVAELLFLFVTNWYAVVFTFCVGNNDAKRIYGQMKEWFAFAGTISEATINGWLGHKHIRLFELSSPLCGLSSGLMCAPSA